MRKAFQFLKEGIENAKKENKKVVVFTHHAPVIDSNTLELFTLLDTVPPEKSRDWSKCLEYLPQSYLVIFLIL